MITWLPQPATRHFGRQAGARASALHRLAIAAAMLSVCLGAVAARSAGLGGTWASPGGTSAKSPAEAQAAADTIWQDSFAGGQPRRADWSRCAQPWDDTVGQCSALQAGPGEEIYWNPGVMRGGRDPVVPADQGGISLLARPIIAGERVLIARAVARQADLPPHTRDVLQGAGWTSAWLQSRPSFPVGTTVSAMLRPGAGASAWGGLWMLNDPAHRRWPPEIDVAEITNDPDGRMRVRQVIHYRDGAGQLRTAGCPHAIMPRGWIVAAVTRLPHEIRFSLNGAEHCRIAAPDGFDDPMTIIVSQQVGGLAAPSTAATAPFALDLRWVRVTRA